MGNFYDETNGILLAICLSAAPVSCADSETSQKRLFPAPWVWIAPLWKCRRAMIHTIWAKAQPSMRCILLNRYSYNFTLAIYDTDNNILYYCEEDT